VTGFRAKALKAIADSQPIIEMTLIVSLHCNHINGETFRRCHGDFRKEILSQAKDPLGNCVKHAPADLLKANNTNGNKDIKKSMG
jgi:hypothetical protein